MSEFYVDLVENRTDSTSSSYIENSCYCYGCNCYGCNCECNCYSSCDSCFDCPCGGCL